MTDNRILWAEAKNRLAAAVSFLGFAPELAELMAKQLGSPKAIDRMTKYIYLARPRSEEMLVDEMLAICDEIDAWRRKKTGQEGGKKRCHGLRHVEFFQLTGPASEGQHAEEHQQQIDIVHSDAIPIRSVFRDYRSLRPGFHFFQVKTDIQQT